MKTQTVIKKPVVPHESISKQIINAARRALEPVHALYELAADRKADDEISNMEQLCEVRFDGKRLQLEIPTAGRNGRTLEATVLEVDSENHRWAKLKVSHGGGVITITPRQFGDGLRMLYWSEGGKN